MFVVGKKIGYGGLLIVPVFCFGEPAFVAAAQTAAIRPPSGIIETANFCVVGVSSKADAARIGAELEVWRRRLCATWLGRELPRWSPKCHVVAHATAVGYARAIGGSAFATLGATSIDYSAGRISRRRIDVRADRPGWFTEALPHELTHLIIADEFPNGELPHWADEGMAMLADTAHKQSLHQRDFDQGRRGGRFFSLARLVSQASYPTAEQVPVFYGQSAALVKFLIERRSPVDFIRFLHRGAELGYDKAIGEVYGLAGLAGLQRVWQESLSPRRDTRPPVALTGNGKPINRS